MQQYLSYMILECRERHAMLSRGMEPYRREIRFEKCRGHRPIVSVMFMPTGAPAAGEHASVFDTPHGTTNCLHAVASMPILGGRSLRPMKIAGFLRM